MRRRPRFTRRDTVLDLTPMVDVVFLLIIFFMVSTTFITLESGLPVDLPQASSSQAQLSETPTVTVTGERAIFLGGAQVEEANLVATLRAQLEASGQGVVVLRADQIVPHGMTVRVMDLIRQAGAQRISIATGG
ncbi:MAG: biopolymer transporter ExbD [Trueperaceae bacterium]